MNLEIKSYVFFFFFYSAILNPFHIKILDHLLDTEALVNKKNVFDSFKVNELLILKSTIISLAKKILTKIVFS